MPSAFTARECPSQVSSSEEIRVCGAVIRATIWSTEMVFLSAWPTLPDVSHICAAL